ncbi:unnamed protein product [Dovyalis caffra]|uniref:Uncharacterized protein n=1 Tax=Dovyalis caffra TaxID=77055 RepID=A0AAV1QT93_9ROSI|nr:unnamed protein product [Dovyalis caffra]
MISSALKSPTLEKDDKGRSSKFIPKKYGNKKVKNNAVNVDRTRDLQIFSLTLSQLSYPRTDASAPFRERRTCGRKPERCQRENDKKFRETLKTID